MLTIEQRAHDLACAVISNRRLIDEYVSVFTKDSYITVYDIYQELFEYYLEQFKADKSNKIKTMPHL